MDKTTAEILIQANNRFYQQQAQSFGKTRNNAWPGWQRVAHLAMEEASSPLRVLDVACGNMRFEAFLERNFPTASFDFRTVDNAPFTACQPISHPLTHKTKDVLAALLEGLPLELPHNNRLTVSFGFMHHIPGQPMRQRFLEELAAASVPGGLVTLSFWRFLDNPQLSAQAQKAWGPACTALAAYGLDPAQLDPGDAFLGWDGKDGVWRYCHSFADEEIDQLTIQLSGLFRVEDRFRADGRDHSLNEYVILRRL